MDGRLPAAIFCSGLFYLLYFFLFSWIWWLAVLVGLISGFALTYLGEFVLDAFI